MISRRALIPRLALLAAGGAGAWLLRDRLPWPGAQASFANGGRTPWIPLRRDNGLIEIEGRLRGELVHVVVDSGAEYSALDADLAQRLGIDAPMAVPILAYGVSGQPTLTKVARVELDLPGLAIRGMRAALLNIAPLAQATGRAFQILVGRDVLREVVLDADFSRRRMAFRARETWIPPVGARPVPLKLVGGAPLTPVTVEGRPPVDVLVDTGATTLLALSEKAAADTGLLAAGRLVGRAPSVSLGGFGHDRIVRASRVEVAGLTLRDVDVQVYTPALRGPAPPGLLGSGLFRRYQTFLDLRGGRLLLEAPGLSLVREPGV